MHTSHGEKRLETRAHRIGTVYYTCTLNPDILPGITIDVSNSGASIYTPHPLDKGVQITIRGDGLWSGQKNATVKWVDRINKDIYRVGLSFN